MKQVKIHLAKSNLNFDLTECGKSKDSELIGFREGSIFFKMPSIEPIKRDQICLNCLKFNSPAIFKQIQFNKNPLNKKKPMAKLDYNCICNKKIICDNELPFDCQLCHRSFDLIHLPRIPIVQYKKSKKAKSNKSISIPTVSITTLSVNDKNKQEVKTNDKSKSTLPIKKEDIIKKMEKVTNNKEKEKIAKALLNGLFGSSEKSDKGKIRQLRQHAKLKMVNPIDLDKPIELKDVVEPELIKRVKLNFNLRNIGIYPFNDNWIITKVVNEKVNIISKVMDYKQAFAEFNRLILIDCEKELKKSKK